MQNINNLIFLLQNSKKTLFILCGYPYSGKSFIARHVVPETGIEVVSIDGLFTQRGFSWDNARLPNELEWDGIFGEAYELTRVVLEAGKSVVFDSTNHTVESRDRLRAIAKANNVACTVIYVKTPVETIWKRWEENNRIPTRAKISRELVQETIDAFEEPTGDENIVVIEN